MRSKILSDNEIFTFRELTRNLDYKIGDQFELLFRGSRDGFDAKTFHSMCDGKGSTVSVIQTDTNNVFGGYTTIPWSSNGAGSSYGVWVTDENAFLFLLRSSTGLKSEIFEIESIFSGQYAVNHNPDTLCAFGGGRTVKIVNNCNISTKSTLSNGTYKIPNGAASLNGDQAKYRVQEIEVFQAVSKN